MVKASIMTAELNHTVFSTDAGWVGILASAYGLQRTTLPQPSAQAARRLLGITTDAADSPRRFDDLTARLRAYFQGKWTAFPDRLDLATATRFQRKIWAATRLIPCGETRSYAWVAEQIGKPGSARAVGQALARNPLPVIVPCHRVTASKGHLGGFSGGTAMKRYLLSLEAPASGRGGVTRY